MRALLVSYNFPPVGGAGVARVVKLAKYLPAHGVTPAVLTVSNPSVPVMDASREADLPPGIDVVRARTFEPGYRLKQAAWRAEASGPGGPRALARRPLRMVASLGRGILAPDPQVLWQPDAQRLLAARLLRRCDDVVFISGPPFSQFLLAPLARLGPGTAVVLDYRDEWTTTGSQYEMASPVASAFGRVAEAALLRTAHAVTTATGAFRKELLSRFRFLAPDRVHEIPNGYDPDDMPVASTAPPLDRFVLTHAGTVFRLTSPRGLLGGLRRLHRDEPALARLLELRFVGRIVETERDAFAGTEALGVRTVGYVPHAEVHRYLAESHSSLCLLDDVPGASRIYPAKIFELMVLGRPCLVLAPPGALAALVGRHRLGEVVAPRDEPAIAAALAARLRAFRDGAPLEAPRPVGIERYHRRVLAGEVAEVFAAALRRARLTR